MVTKEQLEKLRKMEDEKVWLENEIQKHRAAIMDDVGDEKIDLTLAGVRVYWKAGRKKIDHKGAVELADVPDIVEKYSTKKIITAWSRVTKEARIDLAPFTTQPAATLTIEVQ